MKIYAVDLFCGIGGLTHGLSLAGIDVRAGYDNDPSCRFAYEANNRARFFEADVQNIRFFDIERHFRGADVTALVGCAPCQPFSSHRRGDVKVAESSEAACLIDNEKTRNTTTGQDQKDAAVSADCSFDGGRWQGKENIESLAGQESKNCAFERRKTINTTTVQEQKRLIGACRPDLIAMENVPGLAKQRVFSDLCASLDTWGYNYVFGKVSCADHGVPQRRERLILLGSRLGPIAMPKALQGQGSVKTVRDAIGGLPPVVDGGVSEDPAHVCLPLSAINRARIRQSKPGGSWRDWDDELVNACQKRAWYPGPYGRMSWDSVAPTITTQFVYYSTGRFGHPEQDRALTVREGALLQTFPADYALIGEECLSIRRLARQIGNAVPVVLGRAMGEALAASVPR